MGSTSYWEFSYPNLLVVFLNLLFFWNLFIYFIFLSVLVFLYTLYFVCYSKHAVGTAGIRSKNICAKRRQRDSFLIGLIDGTFILHLFTYILPILVNLFNFSKGGGDNFLSIYFIYLPVLVFLYSIFCL